MASIVEIETTPPLISHHRKIVKPFFLNFYSELVKSIDLAKEKIWIATYVINIHFFRKWKKTTKLFDTICDKHKKGVDVRFIVDHPKKNRPNWNVNNFSVKLLQNEGIPVRMPKDGQTAHGKIAIIDNYVCFIGSHNLTDGSLNNPFEVTIRIFDPRTIQEMIDWYDRIWHLYCIDWEVLF